MSADDAVPYLRAGKPVSSEPLALAVFGKHGEDITTALPHTKVMVPCMCLANREPILTEAWIVQLGQGLVEQHVASTAIALDQLDVVTVKAMNLLPHRSSIWCPFFPF